MSAVLKLTSCGTLPVGRLDERTATYALALSDIDFLRWAELHCELSEGAHALISRELKHYKFTASEDAYRAHYAHHEGKFYAGPVRHVLRKDWTRDSRYQQIRSFVASCVARGARRFLDFGCATGHISRTLAREFPQCDFTGTDVVPQAIAIYNSLASSNARAVPLDELTRPHPSGFDVIICAEVLEHVIDPRRTLLELQLLGTTDVQFICTLPQGPWESRGWASNPGAREHVRHWDATDLVQLFGPSCVVAISGMAPTEFGVPVGHAVTLSGPRCGQIDFPAKLWRYTASAIANRGTWINLNLGGTR